jgi:hypothetical protein
MAHGFKTKKEAIKFTKKIGGKTVIKKLSKRASKSLDGMKYMVFKGK